MRADTRFLGQSNEFWAYIRLLSERLGYFAEGDTSEELEDEDLLPVTIKDLVGALTQVTARVNLRVPPPGLEGFPGVAYDALARGGRLTYTGTVTSEVARALVALDEGNGNGIRAGWRKAIEALYRNSSRRPAFDATVVATPKGRPTAFGQRLLDYLNYRLGELRAIEARLMDADDAEAVFKEVKRRTKSTRSFAENKQSGEKKRVAYFTAIVNMLVDAGCVRPDSDSIPIPSNSPSSRLPVTPRSP